MGNVQVISSQRQPPNLKTLLTQSNFSSVEKERGVTKCGDPLCGNCPYMIEGQTIEMENGETFQIQEKMNCKTKNVIYLLVCAHCKRTYIGETGKGFSYRAGEHRTHINNPTYRKLEVSHHIHECAGHLAITFRAVPFFKMPLNCTVLERQSKELFFQKKFLPSLHPGPRSEED